MSLFSFDGKEIKKARAEMSGDTIAGTALFTEYLFGDQLVVKIILNLSGDPAKLIPGKHAVHIHAKASCEGGFKCAGGHFDPGPNGNTDPDMNHPYHAGDLPNIIIDENGKGKLEAVSTRVTLSEGPLCVFSGEGTALMVHANPDPYTSGPHGSGVSGGPRIACGVIREMV